MDPYVLALGYALIALQFIDAYRKRFLTRRQMIACHGLKAEGGYSICEHGGMSMDIALITPLLSWVFGHHRFDYLSPMSACVFSASAAIVFIAGGVYKRASHDSPEAFVHWGTAALAGRVHGFYAVFAMWGIAMFYVAPAEPEVSRNEIIATSCLLTPFFFVGAAKWNLRWLSGCWKRPDALIPALGGPAVVWTIAYIKLA